MSRHKHADLIHDWAEGAEIQRLNSAGIWTDVVYPSWGDKSSMFRIKPKAPEWYENIPEHGVLCWVSDVNASNRNQIRRITAFRDGWFLGNFGDSTWQYAIPLTNDEIKQFLRSE